jgi:hypothetical protein
MVVVVEALAKLLGTNFLLNNHNMYILTAQTLATG